MQDAAAEGAASVVFVQRAHVAAAGEGFTPLLAALRLPADGSYTAA